MKLPALVLLVAMTLGAVACSRSVKMDRLPVERYTAEASGYKFEMGDLRATGFTPTLAQHESYGGVNLSADEVRRVNGRSVVRLASWDRIARYVPFKRSAETVTLKEVPYVFVDP